MSSFAKKTIFADLEVEMRQSYLDYAMSVIVGRALPDIRDGLKPVHRRILYAMHDMRNDWNKPYKKSARITGDVIGKYHPHGDSAIYDAIVRMAQDFSMRYPLVDGQGNFGSVDGDTPAAMRYTEVRLSRIAHELMSDIEKETVDFGPNYDETEEQPLVLPARLPNLLLNGSEGIAVGMATKIPPHNLTEVINACLALIADPEMSDMNLVELIPGPDFPTGGIINGKSGIVKAYLTGRGTIRLRGKVHVETGKNRRKQTIVVTELPYAVKKAPLVEHIAKLAAASDSTDPLNGIDLVRDESDKSGLRVVIELKIRANPQVVENKLYSSSRLESTYGINFVVLEQNQPRLCTLRRLLNGFIRHRREVVTRRLEYELRHAQARAHQLEGFTVALSNLDELLSIIRAPNESRKEIKQKLMAIAWDASLVLELLGRSETEITSAPYGLPFQGIRGDRYWLSDGQTEAILNMRLHRLSGLEQKKIFDEYKSLLAAIKEKEQVLRSAELLMKMICDELRELRDKYGKNDERRTEIIEVEQDFDNEELIKQEDVIVTVTEQGYGKQQPTSTFNAQLRGGRGRFATKKKEGDWVRFMLSTDTHDTLMCFTNYGKVYWTKPLRLERGSSIAMGRPLINALPALETDEKITAIKSLRNSKGKKYIVMVTRLGKIKRCRLDLFKNQRSSGLKAIVLREGDEMVDAAFTNGSSDIFLFSGSRAIRFHESELRSMGRTSMGVNGIKLLDDQKVCSMVSVEEADGDAELLIVDESGSGKRTKLDQFPRRARAGLGVYAISAKKRAETKLKRVLLVDSDNVMLITRNGLLLQTEVRSIAQISRVSGGVRLMRLAPDDSIVAVDSVWLSDEQN